MTEFHSGVQSVVLSRSVRNGLNDGSQINIARERNVIDETDVVYAWDGDRSRTGTEKRFNKRPLAHHRGTEDRPRRPFGKQQFDLMKPTAYFINIGRGRTVVTEDLMDALRSKSISGAGLDVTDPEPLPADHPLWDIENVVITPHMSGRTQESWHRVWLLLRENVRRFAAGEPMLNVVNKQAGY